MSRFITDRFPFYYGWVIVGVTFVIMIVAYGIWWSFPVFYVAILDEFGWSRAETASIFTVGSVVYGIGSLVSGILVDRFGPRKLLTFAGLILVAGCVISSISSQIWHFLIAYGGFLGFGTIAAGYVPVAVVVSNWFVRKRGTALGFALVGTGVAPLLAVFTQHLVSTMGWRASYTILAAVVLIIIIPLAGIFIRTRPQELGLEPDGQPRTVETDGQKKHRRATYSLGVVNKEWAETDWTLRRGIRTHQFWLLWGMQMTIGLGMGIIWTHQVAFAINMGYSEAVAAFIFGFCGVMAAAGRFGGFLVDRMGREVSLTIAMVSITGGIFALLMVSSNTQIWLLYSYAVGFGLGLGLLAPAYGTTAADLFGGGGFGSILGFANIGWGLGSGAGAWLGGAIFDRMGNYTLAIATAIIMFILVCLFGWLAGPRKVRRVIRGTQA